MGRLRWGPWHLGLTDGATDETKARYAFAPRRLSSVFTGRASLPVISAPPNIATRKSSLAAHRLLQYLDKRLAKP